jgi:hypothetical protein
MHSDPIRKCFDNTEGLSHGNLPRGRNPWVHELTNSLRLGTAVPSQDLSGVWVTVRR